MLKLQFSHLFLGRLAKTHKAYVLKNIHIQSIAGTCPCVECVVYGDERYPSKSSKSCPMNFIILSTKTNLPQQQNASWRLDTKEAQIYICACDEKTSKAPPYLHALKLRSSTTASTIIIHTLAICRVFTYRASIFM